MSVSPYDSSGFVVLSDVVPDVILDIRYYSTYNFVGERINGYDEPFALLTRETAAALKNISDEFKQQGLRLKIYDAYRPQRAVNHFKRWAEDFSDDKMKKYFYPTVSKDKLLGRYIGIRSAHSRGSAVDLTLFYMESGRDVDMGGKFDYFDDSSDSDYKGNLTDRQIKNRHTLREAMLRHGFRPSDSEWWHFTLINEPYPDTYFDFSVKKLEKVEEF